MKQGIFISYRRDTGSTMARMIYDRLRLEKKYQCFLDVETLNAGNFREHIAQEMDKCDIFLLILSKNALNRCVNPNDNVRQEIELALERSLPIIPVMAEDFSWPEPMPSGLESIMDLNGVPYIQVYSEQFFERLYSFVETIRSEEKARENAVRDARRAARMAERSARAKEKLKELGQGARSSLAEAAQPAVKPGAAPPPAETLRVPEKPAPESGPAKGGRKKKTLPLILGCAVAVILLTVLGISLLGKNKDPGSLTGTTPAAAVKATATAKPEKTGGETPAPNNAPIAGFQAGPSMEEAAALPLSAKVNGRFTGETAWASFKTGSEEDVPYYLTLQNRTAGSENLNATLLDENGEKIRSSATNAGDSGYLAASQQGRSCTARFDMLKPDTVYYIQLSGKGKGDYALAVLQGDRPGEIAVAKALATPEDYSPASNQDGGPQLRLNTKYNGRYVDGYQWVAFKTGSGEDEKYYVCLENLTAGSGNLFATVVSEYGTVVKSSETNGDDSRYLTATSRGRACYGGYGELQPDTWYYIQIDGKSKADYALAVVQGERSGEIATEKPLATPEDYSPAANQDGGPQLRLNTKYNGRYTDGYQWVAFKTGSGEDEKYYVCLENLTADSGNLFATVVSEYGIVIRSGETNGDDSRYLTAKPAGTACYARFDGLQPDTWYYIQIDGKSKADYTLTVESESSEAAEGGGAGESAAGDQILPESFLLEMEELAAKRLSGLLVEHTAVSFGRNDSSSRDVNTRIIQLGEMELQKDALYFETGGTAAFYLYYQGTVSINEDGAGEYPDAIVAFKLDSFPQKFFSAEKGGEIRYKNSDFAVFLIAESKEEYLRRVYGGYQYVDHEVYELTLP